MPERLSAGSDTEQGGPSLRRFALECIAYGLEHGRLLKVDRAHASPSWLEPGACFVTLRMHGELRGCTGTFHATQSLVTNVASSAYRTAFHDPRFAPVSQEELSQLDVEISLLSPIEPFPVASRAELLTRLSPRVDGLTVYEGRLRATFLPAVWASLPGPSEFVDALFQKAGLPRNYWSPELRFERYTATQAH